METDKTYPAPTSEELVFLLEKQDAMLESLMAEMSICKEQVDYLRKKNEVQDKESAHDRGELVDAHKRMADLVKAVKNLENENGNLQRRISELEAHSSIRPAQSVLDLQEKLRERQFELERRDRTIESLRSELERDRSRNEQLEKDLNSAHKSRNELANTLNSRIESLSKDLAQAQLEAEAKSSKTDGEKDALTSEVEVLKEREVFLDQFSQQLSKDLVALRKEKGLISSRVTTLSEENVALRTKILRQTMQAAECAPQHDEQVLLIFNKLLEDQKHLIAALKEECKLLTEKLEDERHVNKNRMKLLKHEKKELERRIEKLLQI